MSFTERTGSERVDGSVASMDSTPFSVMCIDDNVLLVDALERRLNMEPGFTGLHRVENLSSVADEVERLRPSIILLDVDLPGGLDALSLLDQLVERMPDSRVLVFTGYPSGDLVRRSMARGAWGFVSKGTTSETLISAIRRVVAGQAVIELEE